MPSKYDSMWDEAAGITSNEKGRMFRPGNLKSNTDKARKSDINLEKPMPNDALMKDKTQKPKKSGLHSFFQPAIDRVATLDPTDTLLNLLGVAKSIPEQPRTLTPEEYNFIPTQPEMDPLITDAMNRQSRVKKTFGKIPGR